MPEFPTDWPLTPADEVVALERRVDVEYGDGDSAVKEQTLDEHPRNIRQHRVPVEHAEQLAEPVLRCCQHIKKRRRQSLARGEQICSKNSSDANQQGCSFCNMPSENPP